MHTDLRSECVVYGGRLYVRKILRKKNYGPKRINEKPYRCYDVCKCIHTLSYIVEVCNTNTRAYGIILQYYVCVCLFAMSDERNKISKHAKYSATMNKYTRREPSFSKPSERTESSNEYLHLNAMIRENHSNARFSAIRLVYRITNFASSG